MNHWFLWAGVLAVTVALAHTVLGEVLVFSRMRQGTVIPKHGLPQLRERHVRILWASWHALSIFGLGFAAILIGAATSPESIDDFSWAFTAISISMILASGLVAVATRARHPGWVGLLGVALLIFFALGA